MQVDAFLADSVVTAEGKLYVQGGVWNQLSVGGFPVRHPRIGIALAITVPYMAAGSDHRFSLHLEDLDGRRLSIGGEAEEVAATFNVAPSTQVADGDEQVAPVAINLDGLTFDRPGRYRFVISIDGTPHKYLPFQIVSPSGAG